MNNLEAFISVINGHLDYYGIKKKNSKQWYPKNKKDIEEFIEDLFKTYPDAKKIKKEIIHFIEKNHATTMENDMTLRAKAKDLMVGLQLFGECNLLWRFVCCI